MGSMQIASLTPQPIAAITGLTVPVAAVLLSTILLVEGCALDLALTCDLFASAGITNPVVAVRDGTDAMTLLADSLEGFGPLPAVMFTDLKLLHVDGLGLVDWVRQQPEFDGMKVFVLSGSEDPANRRLALAAGADGYLNKFPEAGVFGEIIAAIKH
jgi:CheY-like chemotaxis protein